MTTLFYRLPRLTVLVIFIAIISGIGAILTLGRQEDPTLVERFGYVLTTLPGADAERIEATVTEPIERALLELSEISEIKSTSRTNVSQVSIDVRDDLSEAEVDDAWTLIRQQVELARAELPQGVSTPLVERVYVGAATMLVSVSWEGQGEAPLAVMSRLAEGLEDDLRNLSATEETEIFGKPREEIRVVADPEALAAAGLSMGDAAALINAADAKVPAGQFRGEGSNIGFEVGGEFNNIARIRSVPLVQRPDGSALRVGDVARVEKGIENPPSGLAFSNGNRAVFVAAYIQSNQRVDRWALQAEDIVNDFDLTVPDDIKVDIIFSQAKYTNLRLNGLAQNLLVSALLVFAVLFFVMGWRSAIVVGLALPLTVALVLLLFRVFNYPLHQMSVTGLVISLGLLIDNAIVVVDEYDQERAGGRSILEAIDHSLRKLFGPLFASTLTTALAFAPIALQPGPTGEFIGMIGTSVIFSVVCSFIVAMTVIPAVAGWLDRPRYKGEKKRWWRDGVKIDTITDGYRWTVGTVLKYPIFGIMIGIIPVTAGFMLGGSLPQQFFPQTERDQFQIEITLPPQASIYEAIDASNRARQLLKERYPQIEGVHFAVGEPGPRVYYNAFNNARGVAGYASGFVQLRNDDDTRVLVADVQRFLREQFPEAQILATPFEQGPPAPAPIAFFIEGNSLEILNDLGNQARRILSETPGVTFTQAQLQRGAPTLTLRADETQTAMSGLRLSALAADLRAEMDGVPAGSILEGIEEVPVRVIGPQQRRGELVDLKSKTVGNGFDGAGTPLASLGEMTLDPQTAVIIRLDGRRVNEIYGFVEPYALPAPIFAAFQQSLEDNRFELPTGYRVIIGGQAENSAEAIGNLLTLAVPLILVMVGAIALVFNSFRISFLIMAIGGMSIGLAFGGVWMFNLPMGFNAIVGSLGLLGIAINGSIVVLSLLQGNEAARNDDIIAQREVVVAATRHIVATTLTTMGGFVPIILQGDVFWMPLASAIAGGVAGSALLALYFAPAVYRIMTMKPIRRSYRLLTGKGWTHPGQSPVMAE
ncbi:MAG: efflux RND transporter permease subunit [Pseudomonadota bacterium]